MFYEAGWAGLGDVGLIERVWAWMDDDDVRSGLIS